MRRCGAELPSGEGDRGAAGERGECADVTMEKVGSGKAKKGQRSDDLDGLAPGTCFIPQNHGRRAQSIFA